jgi:hypothetical protein
MPTPRVAYEASKAVEVGGFFMSDVFNTITSADWRRSLAWVRAQRNDVADQIRERLTSRGIFGKEKRHEQEAIHGVGGGSGGPCEHRSSGMENDC